MRTRDTKSEIRDTAIRLIAAKGFDQTSLREVADEVGITKASLYYHYASKVDLLVAIVSPIFDEMRSVASDLNTTPFSEGAVRVLLRDYIAALVAHRHEGALFVRDAVAIVNALGDRFPEILRINEQLRIWLAGPDPTVEAQLRAAATIEVLGVALTANEMVEAASPAEIEHVLLKVAMSVLGCESAS
ncbi:TetR/AcrR family transcriptional regulator [Antrihabitans sp. YC2-6]|uniref:TetR/AcrR family transcriptional regulator n=1 Tax=Antrihabitans sp. YC2-6 TaxID=2799498 RepID=UPI0018F5D5EB|nr:TetR/AcrR family transcriptional regulator [Antrihabitans sp. YC2-6]MBJ8346157.1 TetR/AcrR family transcriptional regulator [Antrihabitans sp. YC2-6]